MNDTIRLKKAIAAKKAFATIKKRVISYYTVSKNNIVLILETPKKSPWVGSNDSNDVAYTAALLLQEKDEWINYKITIL